MNEKISNLMMSLKHGRDMLRCPRPCLICRHSVVSINIAFCVSLSFSIFVYLSCMLCAILIKLFPMPHLDKKTIKTLTKLCRIHCSEEEEDALLKDLEGILAYVDQLNEIETADVAPCNQVIEGRVNVMREDIVGEVLPRLEFLENVPQQIGGLVRVPSVLK